MDDPLESIRKAPPPPRPMPEAMEAAWTAAACEFHRRRARRSTPAAIARRFWPLAAAAAVAILCVAVFMRPAPRQSSETTAAQPPLEQLFTQGRLLFGARLQAVTVTRNQVVWHLSEQADPAPAPDQFVALAVHSGQTAPLYIAAVPGQPVTIDYQGKPREVEFLPDASDCIIAVGDGILWKAGSPESPITNARIENLTP
jgi:hypothetical protein